MAGGFTEFVHRLIAAIVDADSLFLYAIALSGSFTVWKNDWKTQQLRVWYVFAFVDIFCVNVSTRYMYRSHSVNTSTPFETGAGAVFAPTFFQDNVVLASNRYRTETAEVVSGCDGWICCVLCSSGSVSVYKQDWDALM